MDVHVVQAVEQHPVREELKEPPTDEEIINY